MAKVKFLQQAFVGGEIAPEMQGRIEDVAYANGLAVCRNFTIRPQGTADNRAGFRFVREVKDSSKPVRLIPFTFSGEQTMVLEFGHHYVRFHTDAATIFAGNDPYEVVTPYDSAHLFDLHYVQSADILTLVHPDYPPRELRRYGATDWRFKVLDFRPQPASFGNLRIDAVRVQLAPGVERIDIPYRYVITGVKDGVETQTSAELRVVNDLYTSGNRNILNWQWLGGVSNIDYFYVYRYHSGMFGFLGRTEAPNFEDSGFSPDLRHTPPQQKATFATPNNYPAAVSYFQQRRVFAGTRAEPQKIWMTRSGTESDMSYSVPSRDDDRIEIRVAAREANHIRHILPLSRLLVLTDSAEWAVDTNNTDVLTATSIAVNPHSYVGASNVQPVIVNASMIYAAARGGHIRELAYSRDSGGFVSGDLSLRAPHLFDGLRIVDMAHGKAPYPVLWFVSSNGCLIGNTYVPEQEIGAWHWHDTDGHIESCAVVAEGHEDMLYVVVRRNINGQEKRYVERLESRAFGAQEEAFFVDAGLTYRGAPSTTISGLGHLEGKRVNILADGAVHPQRTVQNGEIHLQHPASVVHIGLPITADMQTLPIVGQIDNASGRDLMKNVTRVTLGVLGSSGIWAGPSEDRLVEAKQRTTEPLGTPPKLKTGKVEIVVRPEWNGEGQVLIRQQDPLPLSIVYLVKEVAVS